MATRAALLLADIERECGRRGERLLASSLSPAGSRAGSARRVGTARSTGGGYKCVVFHPRRVFILPSHNPAFLITDWVHPHEGTGGKATQS